MRSKSFRTSERNFFILKNILSAGVGYSIDQFSNTMSVSSCFEKCCTDSSMLAHRYPKLTSENRCGVKENSNKKTSDLPALCPCLILWSVLNIFGRFSAIPASFFQFFRCFIYRKTTVVLKKLAGMALRRPNRLRTQHRFKQEGKVRISDVFLLLFLTSK